MVSCRVELDPTLVDPETSVMVTWRFGTFEVFSDNFLTVSPLVGDGRTYHRNLTFQVLLLRDTGRWLCEAIIVTLGGNRSTNTSTLYLSVEGTCVLSFWVKSLQYHIQRCFKVQMMARSCFSFPSVCQMHVLLTTVPPSVQFQLRLPDVGGCRDWLLQVHCV